MGDGARQGVLGAVEARARHLRVAVQGGDGGRREAAAEGLVQRDLDLVLLDEEGVAVAPVALRDPALAGVVLEEAVGLVAARLAAEVLHARRLLRVAEGVAVADVGRRAAVLLGAAAAAAGLLEGGEDLDLLEAVLAARAGADLRQVDDVPVVEDLLVLFSSSYSTDNAHTSSRSRAEQPRPALAQAGEIT